MSARALPSFHVNISTIFCDMTHPVTGRVHISNVCMLTEWELLGIESLAPTRCLQIPSWTYLLYRGGQIITPTDHTYIHMLFSQRSTNFRFTVSYLVCPVLCCCFDFYAVTFIS